MKKIEAANLTAQLHYRPRGNPPNTQLHTAISNCFPGLEFDFRAIWRRILVGITILESNNYVVETKDKAYDDLLHHRLLKIDGHDVTTVMFGTRLPGGTSTLATDGNKNAVAFMEWSNTITQVLGKQGQTVVCGFTKAESDSEVLPPTDSADMLMREMTVREIFDRGSLSEDLIKPGELTQGLCSPWQNDYRECACYYWAASRPDFVNVEIGADGSSRGDNWMQKRRTGEYVLDDRADPRLVTYDDLFIAWERYLRFQIGGRDSQEEKQRGKNEPSSE